MMVKGKYVSRVRGCPSEGEPGTTWNRSSERNHCILIYWYSYRNNIAMWPTVVRCCKSIKPHILHMEHQKGLQIHYSKCSNCFPSCCLHIWHHMLESTCQNVTGVMAAHTAWILSGVQQCFMPSYCTPRVSSDPTGKSPVVLETYLPSPII
jgi:hypothetical protein